MSREKNKIAEAKQEHRKAAIRLVKSWVEAALRRYEEPSRIGVPKGDPIGFPKKKRKAAFLLALYPAALRLKDIAALAGVSEGVLRVWRSQEQFKKMEREALKQLGDSIANTIDLILDSEEFDPIRKEKEGKPPAMINYVKLGEKYYAKLLRSDRVLQLRKGTKIIEFDEIGQLENKDYFTVVIYDPPYSKKKYLFPISKEEDALESMVFFLITILPFFHSAVAQPFLALMDRKIISGAPEYSILACNFRRSSYVHDAESLRKWHKKPDILSATKARIGSLIDMLADPEAWKQLGEKGMKNRAEILKEEIFYGLNILAI